jgi:glucan phosphoethanolaminetransferase (alkaline phosphatase superfamily)
MSGWLVDLLILLAVLAIVVIAAWYILNQVELPEPIRKIVMIALVVLVAIVAIILLMQLKGGGLKLGLINRVAAYSIETDAFDEA